MPVPGSRVAARLPVIFTLAHAADARKSTVPAQSRIRGGGLINMFPPFDIHREWVWLFWSDDSHITHHRVNS